MNAASRISPLQNLLIDRTVGILMSEPQRQGRHQHFVCVSPHMIGSAVPHWVVVTRDEFMDMFGPNVTADEPVQLQ